MSTFFLEPVAPFRLDLTVWTLRHRPHNRIDRWDGEFYRRTLTLAGGPVEVSVIQTGPPNVPRLQVQVHGKPLRSQEKQAVTAALVWLLG
jgi:DNA-3-methyladenine glycosylase II